MTPESLARADDDLKQAQPARKRGRQARVWLVGGGGVSLEEFFLRPATDWFA